MALGLVSEAAFSNSLPGAQATSVQQLNPGGAILAGTNMVELTTGTFANANAVVQSLASGAYTIDFNNGPGVTTPG